MKVPKFDIGDFVIRVEDWTEHPQECELYWIKHVNCTASGIYYYEFFNSDYNIPETSLMSTAQKPKYKPGQKVSYLGQPATILTAFTSGIYKLKEVAGLIPGGYIQYMSEYHMSNKYRRGDIVRYCNKLFIINDIINERGIDIPSYVLYDNDNITITVPEIELNPLAKIKREAEIKRKIWQTAPKPKYSQDLMYKTAMSLAPAVADMLIGRKMRCPANLFADSLYEYTEAVLNKFYPDSADKSHEEI